MFKTNENQIIAVYIDNCLYVAMQGNFPIQSFRQMLYGYINPEGDGELNLLFNGEQVGENQIIDISNGETFAFEFTYKGDNDFYENTAELVSLHLLKP